MITAIAVGMLLASDPNPDHVAVDVPIIVAPDTRTTIDGPAVVLPANLAISVAQDLKGCRAEREQLRQDVAKSIPLWVPIVVGIAALAVGAGTVAIIEANVKH